MKFTTLKVREDDLVAVRELIATRRKERKRLILSKRYIGKITDFLTTNEDWVRARIKRNPSATFRWRQLVRQELIMWADIAVPVNKDEFEQMCKRRGFSRSQKQFLENGLLAAGLKDWYKHH
jgi:hypothetical protein